MILKRPYAFLIKYYRLIHIGLATLLCYVVYLLSSLFGFFNNYVKNGYSTTIVTDLDKIYTPVTLYLVILLIIALASAILVLLLHKKKNAKMYIGLIVYYAIVFFSLFYVSSILQGFEKELLASTVARSLRDVLLIIQLPQFLFIFLIALRTIGFNVKKFDFQDERKEFGQNDQDNEEFEIKIKFEGYKIKQKVNRAFREGVYYIKENKFIVITITVVLLVIGLYGAYNKMTSDYDQTYKIGESFMYKNLNINIMDAMLTNLDYKGETLSEDYYLVLKLNVKNNSGSSVTADYNSFKLLIGKKIINPTVNLADNFIDYASDSVPLSYSHRSDRTISLTYKISRKDHHKSKKIRIHAGSIYDDGEYIDKHIFVDINESKIPDLAIANNYQAGQKIKFDDTYLGKTSFTINDFIVAKKYIYRYEVCQDNGECKEYNDAITVPVTDNRHNNRLVVMSVDYLQDMSTAYSINYKSLNSFAENFIKIQYKVDDEIYSSNSINVTPAKSTTLVAFEVPENVERASIIQAVVTVRNKRYIVNLKIGD